MVMVNKYIMQSGKDIMVEVRACVRAARACTQQTRTLFARRGSTPGLCAHTPAAATDGPRVTRGRVCVCDAAALKPKRPTRAGAASLTALHVSH